MAQRAAPGGRLDEGESPGAIKKDQKQSQGPKQAAGVPPLQAICEE